jgi:hypothetical protein
MLADHLEAMLQEHIPYRLTAIDCLRWVCELLQSGQSPRCVELSFDSRPVIASDSFRIFTNPMLEMGAIYCRVLLEFLGVGLDDSGSSLRVVRRRKPDDVGIEHFGLPPLSLDAVADTELGATADVHRACVVTIHIAHKAVAHLTTGRQPDADLRRLHLCSRLVPRLVVKNLYGALNRPEPRYRLGRAG